MKKKPVNECPFGKCHCYAPFFLNEDEFRGAIQIQTMIRFHPERVPFKFLSFEQFPSTLHQFIKWNRKLFFKYAPENIFLKMVDGKLGEFEEIIEKWEKN